MPCSHQTPAGPERQAIRRSRCCLPRMARCRLPHVANFGAQLHGLHLGCLSFAVTVTLAPRKTRFRLVATLGRTGLDPQDLFRKFPSDSSHVISSPFPELCSAHTTLCIVLFHDESTQDRRSSMLWVVRFLATRVPGSPRVGHRRPPARSSAWPHLPSGLQRRSCRWTTLGHRAARRRWTGRPVFSPRALSLTTGAFAVPLYDLCVLAVQLRWMRCLAVLYFFTTSRRTSEATMTRLSRSSPGTWARISPSL